MSSRQLEELQEEISRQSLARVLGISEEELNCLEWVTESNESDAGLLYSYIIQFECSSNEERDVLNKIERLEEGDVVELSPTELDPWDVPEEEPF